MRLFLFLCVMGFASLYSQLASAQDVNEYVTVGDPDAWVKVQELPTRSGKEKSKRKTEYLLVDRQRRYQKSNSTVYARFAEQLVTSGGVEDNSTIEISFDPSYQKVKLHHVNVIRNGTIYDRLDLKEFDLYRVETDRDKLIYNGDLQLAYFIPDVQVGDIIDYAYSYYGKNPAIGPHFSTSFQHQYQPPVQHLHQRMLVDKNIKVFQKRQSDPPAPKVANVDGYQEYTWSFENLEGLVVDSDSPKWFYSYPVTEFSSFENWADVGKHFAPYYAPPTPLSSKIKAVVAQIKKDNVAPERQLRAALDYVQREIRYLGIELGEGGYIPRDPDLVLSRKFGDCKDMTRLLVTILHGLDLQATPLLVDSDLKARVDVVVPTYGAFDHVIVHAKLDGKDYFLDATKGEQMGDLANLQQGNYGKGLVVSTTSPGMIDANETKPEYWKVFTDTYDIVSDPEAIGFKSVSTYYMAQADSTRAWIESDGMQAVEKKYLEYYQNRFPTIEQVKPIEVEKSVNAAKLTLTATYSIPNAWDVNEDTGSKSLEFYPNDLIADFPNFVGAKRTSPYAFSHPIRTHQTLKFLVDETWSFEDDKTEYSFPAFDFNKIATAKGSVFTQEYSFVTKADHVAVDDFAETMAGIDAIGDINGVSLSQGGEDLELTTEDYVWGIGGLWLLIGMLASLIVAINRRNDDQEWRDDLILYPVSILKFLVLSVITVGCYQLFWIYKNWAWIRRVEEEEVSPGWRTFFAPIMNFSLFPKIGNMQIQGYSWYKYLAIPLALIYFLGTFVGSVFDEWDDAPAWLGILFLIGVFTMVPVAMQVQKMNEGREELVALNSKFDGYVIGLILAFLPIFVIIFYAYSL